MPLTGTLRVMIERKCTVIRLSLLDLSSFTCLLMMFYICKVVTILILMLNEFVEVCQILVCFWVNLLVTMYIL